MSTNSSHTYTLTSPAKISRNLFSHQAVLAADDNGVYILDKDTGEVTFTLEYSKITKAYAQLGQLYIKYGFGKVVSVNFVAVDGGNVATTAVNSAASSLYHAKQAEDVQGEIQKWLKHFSTHDIKATQTLSPRKFIIIVIIVSILLFLYRLSGGN